MLPSIPLVLASDSRAHDSILKSKIAQFPVYIIKEFPVFDAFFLIFAAVPPWKFGHSPNINYIFGIFVRQGAISSASFTALA